MRDQIGDRIVGHILSLPVDLVGKNTVTVLDLAPLAVLPEWENRRIGSALVRESLNLCEGRLEPFAIVLGHRQFYPKFGFEPASRSGITCSFSVPEDVFMALPLPSGAKRDRGKIVYPQAFQGV